MTQPPHDTNELSAPRSLVEAFGEMAQHVYSSEDDEETFGRICSSAVAAIAGCDAASITTVSPAGPSSHGVTDPLALVGDLVQYEEAEGPCLDAAMLERWIYTPDMARADRWPRSSLRLMDAAGVRSMFSVRLSLDAAPEATLGGLNLYSRTPDAFTQQDQLLALLLSSLGAVAIDASRRQAHLRKALETRQVIGEAVGILRAQHDVSSAQAFEMLAGASQRMNVKLRDIAGRIVGGGS